MIIEVIGEVVMPKLLAVVINGANDGVLTVPSALGAMGRYYELYTGQKELD